MILICFCLFSPFLGKGLIDKLSDKAQIRMSSATSAFRFVTEKLVCGEIQIKTLTQIFERKHEFLNLLKTGEYTYFLLMFLLAFFSLLLNNVSVHHPFS